MFIKILVGIALFILCYFAVISFLTRIDPIKPQTERQLKPCPDKPNCVLSHSTIKRETIEPFAFIDNDPKLSWQRLTQVIEQSGGIVIINDPSYLHAVFTSRIFRFKDDLEAELSDKHIDVRSASRAGTSDLGQNRKRIEQLRALYLKVQN